MTATIIQPTYFDTEEYVSPKYSADCINTMSEHGRNATPIEVFKAVRYTLGNIELDPASDDLINQEIGAERFFDLESDGFQQDWIAETVFLNAPGKTVTGGTLAERMYWLEQMKLTKKERGQKPKDVKVIAAVQWYRKLHSEWKKGNVKRAIALHYRAGSIGSLGRDILSLPLCLTCTGSPSSLVKKSGRFAFDTIENDQRVAQTANTQSSAFTLFPDNEETIKRFKTAFSNFGVVK